MKIEAFTTRVFVPGDDLLAFVTEHLGPEHLLEGTVLAVTSKIVSLSERRLIPAADVRSKMDLVRDEADHFIDENAYGTALTINEGILIPSAGIDESNSEDGSYILYPAHPTESARRLHESLCRRFKIQNLGIILTDSHTQPLRRGVTGIALAHWGFRATRSLIGKPDLFGKSLKMTHVNVADSLATIAVLAMGEADEARPLATVQGAEVEYANESDPSEIRITWDGDLYRPLFKSLLDRQ